MGNSQAERPPRLLKNDKIILQFALESEPSGMLNRFYQGLLLTCVCCAATFVACRPFNPRPFRVPLSELSPRRIILLQPAMMPGSEEFKYSSANVALAALNTAFRLRADRMKQILAEKGANLIELPSNNRLIQRIHYHPDHPYAIYDYSVQEVRKLMQANNADLLVTPLYRVENFSGDYAVQNALGGVRGSCLGMKWSDLRSFLMVFARNGELAASTLEFGLDRDMLRSPSLNRTAESDNRPENRNLNLFLGGVRIPLHGVAVDGFRCSVYPALPNATNAFHDLELVEDLVK